MRIRSTLARLEREHTPRGKAVILETPQQFLEAQRKPVQGVTYYKGRFLPEVVQTVAIGKTTVHEPSKAPFRPRPEPCPVDSQNRPVSGVSVKMPEGWGEGEFTQRATDN